MSRPPADARPLLRALAVWGASVLCGTACGGSTKDSPPKHRLEGSLSQVMDLGWDTARIVVSETDVSLTFVRQRPLDTTATDAGAAAGSGVSEDYPIIVAYRFDAGETAPARATADLAVSDAKGAPRGVATRNVRNDPRTQLPHLNRGELYFARAPEPDATVHGSFHITFENGIEAASGHTVFGTFDAKVAP